ncbi:hypothetical protein F4780DRAFT_761195 [Xylariomycetidae sp. FL0641]|nr:hypothetical protein F4780DRAFT_761195 [Xylariomycetidae sp. FL0641]
MSTPTPTPTPTPAPPANTGPAPGSPTAQLQQLQQRQPQQQPAAPPNSLDRWYRRAWMVLTPVAAVALALPPRRLDLRSVALGGVVLYGANQLVSASGGETTATRLQRRMLHFTGQALPEKAQRTREALLREREQKRRRLAEDKDHPAEDKKQQKGVLEKVWMGAESDDWEQKRGERERRALAEGGGGYWGLITDHVSEAWDQLRGKGGADPAQGDKGKGDGEEKKK